MPTVTADAEQIALWDRIWGEDREALVAWPHNDQVQAGYPPEEVRRHCVQHTEWQTIRLSMKGQPTHRKLHILKSWWDKRLAEAAKHNDSNRRRATEVQVGNYLGALRRGGQLDDQNRIRKYL